MLSSNRFPWALCFAAAFSLSVSTPAQAPQLQKPQDRPATASKDARPQAAGDKPQASGDKTTTLSVQARLVVVPAVVRDKKGAIVGDLTRESFTLGVDGKPQTVRYFDKDTDLPLTVGLLIDTSGSQTSVLDDERKGSAAFIEKLLAPAASTRAADKAFVIQFAHSAELLQDVTDSRPKLEQALKDVDQSNDRPSFDNGSGSGDNGSGSGSNGSNGGRGNRDGHDHQGGGTVLYDAVYLASDEIESKQTNRRALVLLTDGNDRNSRENLARSIEAAQRADTVIYAIYYKGEEHGGYGNGGGYPGGGRHGGGFPGGGGGGYPGGGGGGGYPGGGGGGRGGGNYERPDGKKILERMCGETGGRMFEVSRKNTLDVIYAQIGEELRQGYRLGFSPTSESAEEGYHRIDLELAGPPAKNRLTVQTRDGYYTAGK